MKFIVNSMTAAAIARFREARELAEGSEHPPTLVLASAYLALHGQGDAEAALEFLRRNEERIEALDRMEAHFVLWRATGDAECLAAAKSVLEQLRLAAPPECQASLVREVPLHRAIADA